MQLCGVGARGNCSQVIVEGLVGLALPLYPAGNTDPESGRGPLHITSTTLSLAHMTERLQKPGFATGTLSRVEDKLIERL